jgi:hypothetical protein
MPIYVVYHHEVRRVARVRLVVEAFITSLRDVLR